MVEKGQVLGDGRIKEKGAPLSGAFFLVERLLCGLLRPPRKLDTWAVVHSAGENFRYFCDPWSGRDQRGENRAQF